jgi:eukaryotic-like serine/threonine-protein kinase
VTTSLPDPPKPFGPYRLLKSLGVGGMGEVWLAEEPDKGSRLVVLKMLRGHLVLDREYVTRFLDEARLVVLLEHPNICRVFDSGKIDGRYYLAMEFVSGWDARTLVERAGSMGEPLPEELALFVAANVLDALAYAHDKRSPETGAPLRLVHRDVSPQNVMIGFEGEVKLIDFGLAASSVKREVTRPEVVMGKLSYMAPEHARGDRVDATADQFAAAMVTYELVVGEGFYGRMAQHEIWHVAGFGGFVPPSWNTLDPRLGAVLKRALATEPKDRWPSCGAFKDALVAYMRARSFRPTSSDLSVFFKDVYVAYLGQEAERMDELPAEMAYVARIVGGPAVVEPPPLAAPPPTLVDESTSDQSRTLQLPLAALVQDTVDTTRMEVLDQQATHARLQRPAPASRAPALVVVLVAFAIGFGAAGWWLFLR